MAQRPVSDRETNVLPPVTIVGSYPRPRWYTCSAWGADFRLALMEDWRAEYEDAVKAMGLDIVSDGDTYEDDLVGAPVGPSTSSPGSAASRAGRSPRSARSPIRPTSSPGCRW